MYQNIDSSFSCLARHNRLCALNTLLVNYYNEMRMGRPANTAPKAFLWRVARRDEVMEYWGTFGDAEGHIKERL
jgi:hypothetical protein